MKTPWTPDAVDTLTRLWGTDLRAAVIADLLPYPITKNAVIGKANRLKLTPRRRAYKERIAAVPTRRKGISMPRLRFMEMKLSDET